MVKGLATLCNESKCHVLSIHNKFEVAIYKMTTGETEVELKSIRCEKDIGVYINSKLNFDSHIQAVVKKANIRMGVIRRLLQR